jgi:hypothetical protein
MSKLSLKHTFSDDGSHVHEAYDEGGRKVGEIDHDHFCHYAASISGARLTGASVNGAGALAFSLIVDAAKEVLMARNPKLDVAEAMRAALIELRRTRPELYELYRMEGAKSLQS